MPGSTSAGVPVARRRWSCGRRRSGLLLRPRRQRRSRTAIDQLRLALVLGRARACCSSRWPPRGSSRAASSRRSRRPVEIAERIERGDLRGASAGHVARRVRDLGRAVQPDDRPPSPTRSAGSRRRSTRTAGSSPTCRTSCGRRSRPSSPRRRSSGEHLDELPPESRRAAELLVADVGRLRDARRGAHGAVALRCARRGGRARAGRPRPARPGGHRRAAADGPVRAARAIGRRGDGPAAAGPHPRQFPRQRPRARGRQPTSTVELESAPRGARDRGVGPRSGRAGGPAGADLRAVHEARPVAHAAAAAAWAWRSPRSTRRCWAATCRR